MIIVLNILAIPFSELLDSVAYFIFTYLFLKKGGKKKEKKFESNTIYVISMYCRNLNAIRLSASKEAIYVDRDDRSRARRTLTCTPGSDGSPSNRRACSRP